MTGVQTCAIPIFFVISFSCIACSGNATTPEAEPETVEITLENWNIYFEFKQVVSCVNTTEGDIAVYFGLKDAYKDRLNWSKSTVVTVKTVHKDINLRCATYNTATGKGSISYDVIQEDYIPETCYYSCEYLGIAFEIGNDLAETFDYRGYDYYFERLAAQVRTDNEPESGVITFYAPICASSEVVSITGTLVFE